MGTSKMGLGNPIYLKTVVEREFAGRLNIPVRSPDGGWLVSFVDEPEVIILDDQLREVQRLNLQAQRQKYCYTSVAMSRDGRLIALSTGSELRLFMRSGELIRRIPHTGWDSFCGSGCFFDRKNRLWYVRPTVVPAGEDDPPYWRTEPKVLTVLEPFSGTILSEQFVAGEHGHFNLNPCPDEESVIIYVGCGQDEGLLFLARMTEGGLVLSQYRLGDRIFYGNFAPSGLEFATTEHGGDDVQVHSFPTGSVLAKLDGQSLFASDDLPSEEKDGFNGEAVFLNDGHILVTTVCGRMCLFQRKDMSFLGVVFAEGRELRGYNEAGKPTEDAGMTIGYESGLTSIHPTAEPGQLLAVYGNSTLCLLDVSPLLSLSRPSKDLKNERRLQFDRD